MADMLEELVTMLRKKIDGIARIDGLRSIGRVVYTYKIYRVGKVIRIDLQEEE